MLPVIPDSIQSQNISQMGMSPDGYRLYQGNVPLNITNKAVELLSKDYGYEEYDTINNEKVFFRVEPHYDTVRRWHKGCTVYQHINVPSIFTLKNMFIHAILNSIIWISFYIKK